MKYTVKNHVVTLSGDVDSPAKRAHAAAIAVAVLNVHQVVNELQVKGRKAQLNELTASALSRPRFCFGCGEVQRLGKEFRHLEQIAPE